MKTTFTFTYTPPRFPCQEQRRDFVWSPHRTDSALLDDVRGMVDIRHTFGYRHQGVKYFAWDNEKNEKLKEERGISFEEIVLHIERGDILDILEHPNPERYGGQRILVMNGEGYAYLVPVLETEDEVILKTITPSRKATKRYLGGEKDHG